ncbi:hypothetical protein Tco_0170195 [Tanacetum coccineum]
MITTNSRIEDKKPSGLILPPMGILEIVWKVISEWELKEGVTKGKDGVYKVLPTTTQEELLLMRRKEARTLAIKTRFGGNANSKKMQKAILKQQFDAFTISSKESLEKGYDRPDQIDVLDLKKMELNWQDCFDCHKDYEVLQEDRDLVQLKREALMTIDEGQNQLVVLIQMRNINHALMAFTVNNEFAIVFSICPSNDSDGGIGAVYDHLVNDNPINDHIHIPSIEQVTTATQKTQPQVPKPKQTVDPSYLIFKPITLKLENRCKDISLRIENTVFVCGSLSLLIKTVIINEKQIARKLLFKTQKDGSILTLPLQKATNRAGYNVNTGHGIPSNPGSVLIPSGTQRSFLKLPRQHNMYTFDMKPMLLLKGFVDDDGILLISKILKDEVDVTTNHTLRIQNASLQCQILGVPQYHMFRTSCSLKQITEALCLEAGLKLCRKKMLQFKLQQVWVLVDFTQWCIRFMIILQMVYKVVKFCMDCSKPLELVVSSVLTSVSRSTHKTHFTSSIAAHQRIFKYLTMGQAKLGIDAGIAWWNRAGGVQDRVMGSLEIHATIDTIRYKSLMLSIKDSLTLDDATGNYNGCLNADLFEGMGANRVSSLMVILPFSEKFLYTPMAILSPPSFALYKLPNKWWMVLFGSNKAML